MGSWQWECRVSPDEPGAKPAAERPTHPAVAVQKCYDLVLWLLQRIEKFPRGHRFTVGDPASAIADGTLVYQGDGTTTNDTPTGSVPVYYTVFSMSDGQAVASTGVSIVPARPCLTGQVTADGQAVAGANISVGSQTGTLLTTTSDSSGGFSVCDLAPGYYTVSCEKTGLTFTTGTQSLLLGDESMAVIFDGTVVETLSLASPVGGERWAVGSTQYVGWASTGSIENVRVELSRDGGASWETLAASTPNDGALTFKVTRPESGRCLLRVSAVGGTTNAQSPGTFAIEDWFRVRRHLRR
jgi:Carboxypeptidase regulatory-like domain